MPQKLRLYSGLILFTYVLMHLLNQATGIISPEAMETVTPYLTGLWQFPPLEILLVGALICHFFLATGRLTARRSLRLRKWEWAQMLLGLSIPLLLFTHILGTRISDLAYGVASPYERVLVDLAVFKPVLGWVQALAVIVVWTHGCIGIYFWLRVKPGFRAWRGVLGLFAVVVPTLGLAGYAAGASEVLRRTAMGGRDYLIDIIENVHRTAASVDFYNHAVPPALVFALTMALGPFVVRQVRQTVDRIKRGPILSLPDGRTVRVPPGATVLEALRESNVAMASVCGGHGRCTTCRIHCGTGLDELTPPGRVEKSALLSINAPHGWRLACQVRPQHDLAIAPLLPPNATARDGRRPGGLSGSEQQVVVLFTDLRDSTRLGESKMPYDVLFILNQFFAEMTEALRVSGGLYAQFNGDGLMALYGLQTRDTGQMIAEALHGATEMLRRIEALNEHLASELPHRLRIGIGMHIGEAIVGEMGPPGRETISAIGDTINTAARLEGRCKEHGVPLILSQALVDHGQIALPEDATAHEVELRGKSRTVTYYAFEDVPRHGGTTAPDKRS